MEEIKSLRDIKKFEEQEQMEDAIISNALQELTNLKVQFLTLQHKIAQKTFILEKVHGIPPRKIDFKKWTDEEESP